MASTKVTITLDPGTLERARVSAEREGLSLSAWLGRAARREALRAAPPVAQWLVGNPDARDDLERFERIADDLGGDWSDLKLDDAA